MAAWKSRTAILITELTSRDVRVRAPDGENICNALRELTAAVRSVDPKRLNSKQCRTILSALNTDIAAIFDNNSKRIARFKRLPMYLDAVDRLGQARHLAEVSEVMPMPPVYPDSATGRVAAHLLRSH